MTELGAHEPVADSAAELAAIPPPPAITANGWQRWPILLADGRRPSLGWQERPERKGGKCYLVGHDSIVADIKVIKRFPATESGWTQAWQYLMNLAPEQEAEMRAKLESRAANHRAHVAMAELDARTKLRLRNQTFLGGYSAEQDLTQGHLYDLRFTEEELVVTAPVGWPPLIKFLYREIEELEIGGPGLTSSFRSGQRLVMEPGGFGFVAAPTIFGTTSIQTIIRVQLHDSEFYFQDSTTVPHALRVQLSRPLAAIRDARAASAERTTAEVPKAVSVVAELKDLASMLEAGLLTRDEFDQMKTRLLGG